MVGDSECVAKSRPGYFLPLLVRTCTAAALLIVNSCVVDKPPSMAAKPIFDSTANACSPQIHPSDEYDWNFRVSFAPHDATLDTSGRQVLDSFLKIANTHDIAAVGLTAQLDDTERTKKDTNLWDRRISVVTDYLIDHGFGPLFKARRRSIYVTRYGLTYRTSPVVPGAPDPYSRFVHLEIVGEFVGDPTLVHRQLLCRNWLFRNCIEATLRAPEKLCKSGVDFLIRGDDTVPDLDWRTRFVP